MLHRRPSASELTGSRPAFILTVHWLGRIYRFSDRPLIVYNNAGDALRYDGSLVLRSLQDSLKRRDGNPQGGTASMSVVFPDVSMMAQYMTGRILEVATCELSMIFVRGDVSLTVYERRMIQIVGPVTQPQIGFPDRAEGYAAFTITARPFDDTRPILNPKAVISNALPFSGVSVDYHGSAYPLVFGAPGDADTPGSPAYMIRTTSGDRRVLIAVGRVHASRVTLYDENNIQFTLRDVNHVTDGLGTLYAWVSASSAPGHFNKVDGKHFVGWHNAGEPTYGLVNPYGPGPLQSAGDIIRYLLELSGADVDDGAFRSASPALERYTFSGYVNDTTVRAWQLLSSQILPFVPVQLRIGSNGIYPVSLLPLESIGQLPQITIDAAKGIAQASPVQITQKLSDINNELAINYRRNDLRDRLMSTLIETADATITGRARLIEGQRSRELYGSRPGAAIDASYLEEDESAEHVLRWLIYDRGFLHMAVQVSAAPRYGWLMVGDQISLTAADLSLTGQRATVLSKAWTGSAWRFVLTWSTAPMEMI